MKRIKNGYELSTGRKLYANHGLISIAWDDEDREWEIGEGYDGHLYPQGSQDYSVPDAVAWSEEPWTAEERREVADYMIAQWRAFAEAKVGE